MMKAINRLSLERAYATIHTSGGSSDSRLSSILKSLSLVMPAILGGSSCN